MSAEPPHTCPLCQFTETTQEDVYVHLLTSHRKSAISSVLLDEQRTPTETGDGQPVQQ